MVRQLERMTNRRTANLAMIVVVLWISSAAMGQVAAGQKLSPPLVSHHDGIFNGKQLQYTATVEGLEVSDAKGKPAARVVTFGYTAAMTRRSGQLCSFSRAARSPHGAGEQHNRVSRAPAEHRQLRSLSSHAGGARLVSRKG